MFNQIFEISVRSFDIKNNQSRDKFRFFGKTNAIKQGMEFGICDNVIAVDVIDVSTGEVVLSMDNGKVSWLAED